ncbi:5-hydroxytryptamine receptor 3A-like isoform X4 [Mobula hypostoma]|uniref:5-hydroxytryptamine receptor 3A-like isoform X4 n=1 Tax=Mobula hypostoma TaxID=723540 RepID=UPI002FC2ABBC
MSICTSWATVAIILTVLLSSEGQTGGNQTESPKPGLLQLSAYLMANYSKGVRPVLDWRKTTTVAIDLMVYAILNVDEKNQVLTTYIWYRQFWTDEFLTWNPQDFDDIKQLSIPTANIWVPDILINEFVDVGKSPDIPYVYVNYEGQVKNYKPIQVVTACSLDIYNFPFDVQNCTFTFTSWLHNIRDINISLWRSPELVKYDRNVFMNQGEWELLYVDTQYNEFNLEREVSDGYAEMHFFLVIRRRPLFYAVSLLLPSIFLMVMDIIGFYLPPDSGERVSFKITLLLGYSVFLIIVSDTLPATAIGTPLIAVQLNHFTCENGAQYDKPVDADLSQTPVDSILQEISAIRQFLEKREEYRDIAKEWLQVGYVLDVLLFRVYLVAVLAYGISLGTLWSIWQYS